MSFQSHNFPPLRDEKDDKRPKIYIQWKGTDACLDLYCVCGEQWHMDEDFLYFVKCPYCGRVYETSCHIAMYELTLQEILQLDPFQIHESARDED